MHTYLGIYMSVYINTRVFLACHEFFHVHIMSPHLIQCNAINLYEISGGSALCLNQDPAARARRRNESRKEEETNYLPGIHTQIYTYHVGIMRGDLETNDPRQTRTL
jgi:hypothetical protein